MNRQSRFRWLVVGCGFVVLALLVLPWSMIAGGQSQDSYFVEVTKTPVTPDPSTPVDVDLLPAVLRSDATLTPTQPATPTIFVTKTPMTPRQVP